MIDALLLLALLAAAGAAGLVTLRALGAAAGTPGERLVEGLAVGLGIAGMVGLALAARAMLRPVPIVLVGVLMLVVGGGDLARAVRALEPGVARRAWPYLLVCAVVLAVEIAPMLAPPVGGDQTKYQLAYPRLYAQHHGLVPTPWSFWGQMQFLPRCRGS
jgi:hypothetical protein